MNYGWKFVTIVQETGIKIPHGKEMQKAKWPPEEALQITEKKRSKKKKKKKKAKEKRKGIPPLNVKFQRIARRDKKGFLSYQCKEIEKNNRIGKTRDLFKKMRDTKGTLRETWAQERTEMVWT